jgi:hypothetical protein
MGFLYCVLLDEFMCLVRNNSVTLWTVFGQIVFFVNADINFNFTVANLAGVINVHSPGGGGNLPGGRFFGWRIRAWQAVIKSIATPLLSLA